MRQPTPNSRQAKTTSDPRNGLLARKLSGPILADSLEVKQVFYSDRLRSLHHMLEHLNVLEDAPEIEFLCREVILAKESLRQLQGRKKYPAA